MFDVGGVRTKPKVVVLRMQHHLMINYNYLIVDPVSARAVIVDPAWQMDRIDHALEKESAQLSGILITHSHPDHLNLAGPLADARGCPIWMSSREIDLCGFRHPRLVPITTAPWTIGAMQIEPLWTPGHTPGCLCYLIGDNLFTGDTLFAEGCGICPDLEAAHAMFASLEYLKALITPETRIFPGHSYGTPPGQRFAEVLPNNMYLHFSNRKDFAAFRMRPQKGNLRIFGT